MERQFILRRFFIAALLCAVVATIAGAQSNLSESRLRIREAEWQNYSIPHANFTRFVRTDDEFLVRIPSGWKSEREGQLNFEGPHSSQLNIVIDKIPDGWPLSEYVNAVLRHFRDLPGVTETIVTRRTQLQDVEAREIVFEALDAEGELKRTVLWITTRGSKAISFIFGVPSSHAAEVEPYFKGVIQSVMFPQRYELFAFETMRARIVKSPSPAPIHETAAIVTALEGVTGNRQQATEKLAAHFASNPDLVIDLVMDRRVLVRAAAVEAAAMSKNSALEDLLWRALSDPHPLVSDPAARSVASLPHALSRLSHESMEGFHAFILARVWPYLGKNKRSQLLAHVFRQTAGATPSIVVAPRPSVITVTPGKLVPLDDPTAASAWNSIPPTFVSDANVQIGMLTLLPDLDQAEFKIPFARILAANQNTLSAVALQVALRRRESVPVELLLKLLSSRSATVRELAAKNLGFAGQITDIPQMEAIAKQPEKTGTSQPSQSTEQEKAGRPNLKELLALAIQQIRFRDQLATAGDDAAKRAILEKGLADEKLSGFVWQYFAEQKQSLSKPAAGFVVAPMAENLLPENVEHFVSIRNPAQAARNFYESLQGIQMDSEEGQLNLSVLVSNLGQALGNLLAAPPDAKGFVEYTGIKRDSPINLAAWRAASSPPGVAAARRQAVVLQVADPARLEFVISNHQETFGSFGELPYYGAVLSRSFPFLPTLLPLTAKILTSDSEARKARPIVSHTSVAQLDVNGMRIKAIQHPSIDSDGVATFSTTFLAFIGETAILTPDLQSLKDLMKQASGTGGPTLDRNPEFQRAAKATGDAVFFADLGTVFGLPGKKAESAFESGTLTLGKTAWENSHQVNFVSTDWAKSFLSFNPKELSAPRELLPASTVMYGLVKIDLNQAGTDWPQHIVYFTDLDLTKVWTTELAREVLPELESECGFALLDLPELQQKSGSTALFCKLRSDKIAAALNGGTLLGEKASATGVVEIKSGASSLYVTVRRGFLVVANRANALDQFDPKASLASTTEYVESLQKAPAKVVALGGYNLEAAVNAVGPTTNEVSFQRRASLIASVARAFHSQSFYATGGPGSVQARSSVSMDHKGRFSVAELLDRPRQSDLPYAAIAPRGLPLGDHKTLTSVRLRFRATTVGALDQIKRDIATESQLIEPSSANELVVKINARRSPPTQKLILPIAEPSVAQFLKPTRELPAADENVVKQAREIIGEDKDAWSVARKLADWTYKNLQWKMVASAQPAQTLATREADCSEFSQLYVAMARAVGLPARLVSGLAFSGSSFGGHAWVEVWIGRWIELDPTWGTHYVDATHIRNASDALLAYGFLDTLELEVLAAERSAAEYQQTARALTEELVRTIEKGEGTVLEVALDLSVITDQLKGAGSWAAMTETERDRMASAQRRAMVEILVSYQSTEQDPTKLTVLGVKEAGDRAEALIFSKGDDAVVRLDLLRRNGAWFLTEVTHLDLDFSIVSETLAPAFEIIQATRAGQKPSAMLASDFVRGLMLLQQKPAKTIELADRALQVEPDSLRFRHLKALALINAEKTEEATKLLAQLAEGKPAYAPAVRRLARLRSYSEDKEIQKLTVGLFELYTTLEPFDPRGYLDLGDIYENEGELAAAEKAFRKAIEIFRADNRAHVKLLDLLLSQKRFADLSAALDAGVASETDEKDLFGALMENQWYADDLESAEALARIQPARMKRSVRANLALARISNQEGKPAQALSLARFASTLDPESAEPLLMMSYAYAKLSRWSLALSAAERAIKLDPKDAYAHYQRACALARLGRLKQAIAALERAFELEPTQAEFANEDPDLKSLYNLPAFKALTAESDQQQPVPTPK